MEVVLLEIVGLTAAMLYLFLVSRRTWMAWPAYILSSCVYAPIFWRSQLYADAALQLFFVGMGVAGWRAWSKFKGPVSVVSLPPQKHVITVICIACATAVLGIALYMWTSAGLYAFPDAFLLIGSIGATFLTLRRVVENWHYWIVINATSALLYASKGIWLTCLLGLMYLCLSVRGLMMWKEGSRSPVASARLRTSYYP
jgi:nicotinamide mononucleotide transporter